MVGTLSRCNPLCAAKGSRRRPICRDGQQPAAARIATKARLRTIALDHRLFGTNTRLDDRAPIEVLGSVTDTAPKVAHVRRAAEGRDHKLVMRSSSRTSQSVT
ncbi:hypothetical protein BST20_27830 [Mycobacterium branderi]|uniref:Uncharacterized protein n=1 Tax=Mycobacterium branderi TaxID=43348 RepID=A0A7I7WEK1_9MYCO|nr:hypothetical protein BST20_27830 [Mycobacterium branderi]BBZ15041.1 hypothetical protein MBRA_52360 [Mycobacterium branderi]